MPSHLNVEIKARCDDPKVVLQRLQCLGAVLQGVDRQVDTYFHAATGRLKLRTGNIENSLIHYRREDHAGPKDSHVTLIATRAQESEALRSLLAGGLGIVVEVHKLRHILWIDNVKFHVDEVRGLGAFVEIEAIDRNRRDRQRFPAYPVRAVPRTPCNRRGKLRGKVLQRLGSR